VAELGAARLYDSDADPLEQVAAALQEGNMRAVAQAWRASHRPMAAPALAKRLSALLQDPPN
jgi:hypothetical protein